MHLIWPRENSQFLAKMVDQLGGATPDPGGYKTVAGRICEAIKSQIRSGMYGPGARLPSTRAFAAEWGVSRTTVTAAYEQLAAEGYLETRQGARAQVAHGLATPATPQGQPGPSEVP